VRAAFQPQGESVSEKSFVVFDTEVYPNYFLAAFKNLKTGKVVYFERYDGQDFEPMRIKHLMHKRVTIGFNSRSFDLPILYAAIEKANNASLKKIADYIIEGGHPAWRTIDHFNLHIPSKIEHVDLIEVAPGQASLKIYGGRLHAPRMQDLPFAPDRVLTEKERKIVRDYCINDLDTTELLFNKLRQQVDLRIRMGEEYGHDLRSKSDAQIAEAVIRSEIEEITGESTSRPEIKAGTKYTYTPPTYIEYEHPALRTILDEVKRAKFEVAPTGKIIMPDVLAKAKIAIGQSVYRMGIGGLHSSEKRVAHVADENTLLIDRDVASYYPAIILTCGLFPKHLGEPFLKVYKELVEKRLAAKAKGDKVVADSLKITINGSFGKLGSKYSVLYSPDLMIQTTVTGQLALLLFIERLEAAGISVVSANTDGIVMMCAKDRQRAMEEVVKGWERDTGFETEATTYRALYSRDVNNYVALKNGGGYKGKGAYADPGLQKNPNNVICVEAAVARLMHGTPVDETIRACRDIRKFVTIRTVTGGAYWREEPLGKAIRFYYAKGLNSIITYAKNGNKVPRSEGARPVMQLPDKFPKDIDYRWYIREAKTILEDIAFDGGCGDDVEDLI
jgi:hypothetical protein